MAPTIHKIDPNGDTLLILRNANAPFAAGDANSWPNALPKYRSERLRKNERELVQLAKAGQSTTGSTREVHFQLSSKHLTLTSGYFRGLMTNNWREASSSRDFAYSVTAEDWDETALLMVMNIIHCQTAEIPYQVGSEMVAKVALIVDYYQCRKAVSFYVPIWIKNSNDNIVSVLTYGRSLLLRFFITYVFSNAGEFETLTEIIIRESRGPIHSLGLPFPQDLIDALENKRKTHVSKFIVALYTIIEELIVSKGACSSECSSMSIGILMKAMKGMKLFEPKPTPPFEGYSAKAIYEAVSHTRAEYNSKTEIHSGTCNLSGQLMPIINQYYDIEGLKLDKVIKS